MSRFSEVLSKAVERVDGWVSLVTGVGTNLGRSNFQFRRDPTIPLEQLEAIYHGDGYAARICDAVPEGALRQGIKIHTNDTALDTAISSKIDTLHAVTAMEDTWAWARALGGALLWIGADDGQDPAMPLNLAEIKSVDFLTVITRRECFPDAWYTETSNPKFGQPATYRIQRIGSGGGSGSAVVHESRVIRFEGARTSRYRRLENQGWSESELQRVLTQLTAFNGSFAATQVLMQDASQGVFKIKDLMQMMVGDNRDALRDRLQIMDEGRSVARSVLIDADGEDFTRTEVNFSGLPTTIDKFMQYLSGVAIIPVTVLFGQSPAGLSATGDSDIRWWYDQLRSKQQKVAKPRIERLVKLICLAKNGPTNGVEPKSYEVKFPSLWQNTPTEEANLRKTTADTDNIYLTTQVLTPEEVGTSRFREEGWSAETSIELASREAIKAADGAAGNAGANDAGDAPDPAAIGDVVARVASREIDRSSGIGILTSLFAMTPEQAEAIMGETGKTSFSTPAPEHAAQLADAQGQLAGMTKSHQATKAMLRRVLARNKAGELVVGSPVGSGGGADITDAEVDALMAAGMEADATPDTVLDALAKVRTDARAAVVRFDQDTSTGLAIVLPVPAAIALGIQPATPDAHCTLVFLGRAAAFSPDTMRMISTVVRAWAERTVYVVGQFSGVGRFTSNEGAETRLDPIYLTPSCPGLAAAREDLVQSLRAIDVESDSMNGFVPHVCVAYVPQDAPTPWPSVQNPLLCFDRVEIWAGAARESFPLVGAEMEAAE